MQIAETSPERATDGQAPSGGVGVRLPELLAPAGDWECVRAAVENGADAIYFGLDKFNARMRADNFTEADLPRVLEYLHQRGVKGYVTFNTLTFENELEEAEQYLRSIIAAGVDAAIVQDVGICRLIRSISPDFPIHASTQMTITSARGLEFARNIGCSLVVLARECTLKEIEKMRAANPTQMPLEVFVHGALCVAYSGQCLTSEALGGRSANRGECAQACRMPYELIADGKPVELGDRKYLLSPQDLAGLPVVPELVRLEMASLKIEGRLKSPGYVANITRIYREALDNLANAAAPPNDAASSVSVASPAPKAASNQYAMEMAFSRGLYTGWFGGINNQELVHGRFGKKRGVYLGEIVAIRNQRVALELTGPVKPGDGVVFDASRPEEKEEGGRVYEIDREPRPSRRAWLSFGHGDLNFSRIRVGNKLWKTSDPELERELRQSFEGETPRFRRPVRMESHGVAEGLLRLVVRDAIGSVVHLESQLPLAIARKQPLTSERLKDQLGRLGGTPFFLSSLKNNLEGELMLPVSELNRMRREAVAALIAERARPKRWTISPSTAVQSSPISSQNGNRRNDVQPQLAILVRNLSQLDAVMEMDEVGLIYCDFEDPKKYRDAVARVRCYRGSKAIPEIFVAPPRIFKVGEEWILNQVRSSNADGYLVRNYDHLEFFKADRTIGDYSLNIANRFAADYFKNEFALERVTASYDMNLVQLDALLAAAPADWFEITIHQHMPMFHMEHCVFCAFLTNGKDYRDCGRPCDTRDLKLRDRVGAEHPVKADVGCRNTVFNALAQTGAEFVPRMLSHGVRHFRIEFLNEGVDQVRQTIRKYSHLLRGEISGQHLWRELKLMNQLGVTRGQLL